MYLHQASPQSGREKLDRLWSPRQTAIYIFITSLLFWILIFGLILELLP